MRTIAVRVPEETLRRILAICKQEKRRPAETARLLIQEGLGKRAAAQGLLFDGEVITFPGRAHLRLLPRPGAARLDD